MSCVEAGATLFIGKEKSIYIFISFHKSIAYFKNIFLKVSKRNSKYIIWHKAFSAWAHHNALYTNTNNLNTFSPQDSHLHICISEVHDGKVKYT